MAGDGTKRISDNRKARFNFELMERFEAGVVLTGTEVKSLRNGKLSLAESYCRIESDGAVYLVDAHIAPYAQANQANHDPLRSRKLLLHKREIARLIGKVREKGLTLVPTRMYFKRGRAKLEFALAKGKKQYDKREAIKKRDTERELRRGEHPRDGARSY